MHNLESITWGTFRIGDILTIENCKCSKVSALKDGDVPYIGATANNNGVLRFVERKECLITKGNCIVFICDGEGSIGLSIYKSEDFIGTTTVKVGRSKHLNKYTAMFITTVADTVRGKYNFGYKRNEKNLKRETISLPITTDGVPDWSFMEEYMKQVPSTPKRLSKDVYMSLREFVEFFSVDIMQRYLGNNVWVKMINLSKEKFGELEDGWRIYADVKFDFEVQYIKDNNGFMIGTKRPSNKKKNTRISNTIEASMDYTINTEGELESLFEPIYSIAKDIYEKTKR
jgi:hypothetical protein